MQMQAFACFHHNIYHYLFVFMITQSCLCQILEQPVPINESLLVPRVVNGRPAQLGDVPYQIGFKTLKSRVQHIYSTFCGGVIIAPSKLLSAAHCFEAKQSACFSKSVIISGKALTRKFAVAGTLLNDEKYRADSSSGSQWRRLKMVVYPAKYKFPKHDICVVITIKPFFFNGNVAPIPIASRFIDYKGTCLVSGYGRLSPAFSKQKLQSDKLMLADLDIIPTYYCSRRHNRNMRHFICTTNQVSDTAQGDSGGPLVCYKSGDPKDLGKGVVVGVVSGSRKHAGSFFTRVSSFYKYIMSNKADCISLTPYCLIFTTINYGFYLFCSCFIWLFFFSSQ
ncbi:unnamed protein product [Chilo suppressalis]|uniref:Peptidase S1 domain-containing protein n=1 Tax=Chilo suppressalis TaxID=168631 RepID=A0ABN8EAT7_CHISP|nr:unnamed protein product [Chilo suppressalis]